MVTEADAVNDDNKYKIQLNCKFIDVHDEEKNSNQKVVHFFVHENYTFIILV